MKIFDKSFYDQTLYIERKYTKFYCGQNKSNIGQQRRSAKLTELSVKDVTVEVSE